MTMAAPDIDAQVMEIGSASGVASTRSPKKWRPQSGRANVEFYKDTGS
jgi:hypothetical protein